MFHCRDLGSTNGTVLNKMGVRSLPMTIQDGDVLKFGKEGTVDGVFNNCIVAKTALHYPGENRFHDDDMEGLAMDQEEEEEEEEQQQQQQQQQQQKQQQQQQQDEEQSMSLLAMEMQDRRQEWLYERKQRESKHKEMKENKKKI